MKALLDTHAFLWWISDDPRLPSRVRKIIQAGRNRLFLSAASGWEIAIKAGLGRLNIPKTPEVFIPEQLSLNAIESLPIQMSHVLHVATLPAHHRDPFDRLLVAQAQLENLPILSADPQFTRYAVKTLW